MNNRIYNKALTELEIKELYERWCKGELKRFYGSNKIDGFICKKCHRIQAGFYEGFCQNKNWKRDIRNRKINDLLNDSE